MLHLQYKVGRGNQFNLWYDPWINGNAINPSIALLSNSGLTDKAKVCDIIHATAWHLPVSNHHDVIIFRRLIEALPPPPDSDDCISWGSHNINTVKARHIWDSIRHRHQQVNWHKITWNNLHVPRYSFLLWLGFWKRLQTNDISSQYTGRIILCPLCQHHNETFAHLFFDCDYSRIVLGAALSLGNWNHIPMDWDGLISFLISFQGTKLTRNIMYLTVAASFYKIWEARNSKVHNDNFTPPRSLAKDVTNIIKSRLSKCTTFLKATNFCPYYCNWLL